jgi:hypothetical protein
MNSLNTISKSEDALNVLEPLDIEGVFAIQAVVGHFIHEFVLETQGFL